MTDDHTSIECKNNCGTLQNLIDEARDYLDTCKNAPETTVTSVALARTNNTGITAVQKPQTIQADQNNTQIYEETASQNQLQNETLEDVKFRTLKIQCTEI